MTDKVKVWVNRFIGWNSRYGLHISDGVEQCSGTDEEAEKKAKKMLYKYLKRIERQAYERGIQDGKSS